MQKVAKRELDSQSLNDDSNKSSRIEKKLNAWSAEEEKLLFEAVRHCKSTWSKVTNYYNTNRDPQNSHYRTKKACERKWGDEKKRWSNEAIDTQFTNAQQTPFDLRTRNWTDEENQILFDAAKRFSCKEWIQIAACLPKKTYQQCLLHWDEVKLLKLGPWDPQETLLLQNLAEIFVDGCSQRVLEIAKYFPNRNSSQCRDKILRLDPNNKTGHWSKEEENWLAEAVGLYPGKWNKIAAYLREKNPPQDPLFRSPSVCKKKWHYIISLKTSEDKINNNSNEIPEENLHGGLPLPDVKELNLDWLFGQELPQYLLSDFQFGS